VRHHHALSLAARNLVREAAENLFRSTLALPAPLAYVHAASFNTSTGETMARVARMSLDISLVLHHRHARFQIGSLPSNTAIICPSPPPEAHLLLRPPVDIKVLEWHWKRSVFELSTATTAKVNGFPLSENQNWLRIAQFNETGRHFLSMKSFIGNENVLLGMSGR
jgi:hypothetical protein